MWREGEERPTARVGVCQWLEGEGFVVVSVCFLRVHSSRDAGFLMHIFLDFFPACLHTRSLLKLLLWNT